MYIPVKEDLLVVADNQIKAIQKYIESERYYAAETLTASLVSVIQALQREVEGGQNANRT